MAQIAVMHQAHADETRESHRIKEGPVVLLLCALVCCKALCCMQGHPGIVVDKLRQDWKSTVFANWKLWVPSQFINFRFVPQQLQVSCFQSTLAALA